MGMEHMGFWFSKTLQEIFGTNKKNGLRSMTIISPRLRKFLNFLCCSQVGKV